jgi:Flp pilus assembly protein TadG
VSVKVGLKCAIVRDESAAVAPTLALALFALVGIGGLAFDYARMAAMDTELQNAADQAALAAASQLDGLTGTCERAGKAANEFLLNQTRFSNDGDGLDITIGEETDCDAIGNVKFYKDKARTEIGASDGIANYVEVTVNVRAANYALTPIIGAFSSGSMTGTAFAGLGSAICRIPPVFICNPDEPDGNTNAGLELNVASRIGFGLELISEEKYAPGNVGFLVTDGRGAPDLAKALGWDQLPYNCNPTDSGDAIRVETEPGMKQSVRSSFNTRFDMQDGPGLGCVAGGNCPPSSNVRKDLILTSSGCDHKDWAVAPGRYFPATEGVLDAGITPEAMGYPRDICQARDSFTGCDSSGRFGNGVWDRAAYFRSTYPSNASAVKTAMEDDGIDPDTATRYQIYRWEAANSSYLTQKSVSGGTAHAAPFCWAGSPAGGIVPTDTTVDRRRMSAAIINCKALAADLKGRKTVPVANWIDFFLVEPVAKRDGVAADGDIYVEIIGETDLLGGNTGGGALRRDSPYLIE